jgi:hypothetical protein
MRVHLLKVGRLTTYCIPGFRRSRNLGLSTCNNQPMDDKEGDAVLPIYSINA